MQILAFKMEEDDTDRCYKLITDKVRCVPEKKIQELTER